MSLVGKICLVTGASRGIGRGIALALGEQGATVYITGRTLDPDSTQTGSLKVTADEITARGGTAIPIQCDHEVDAQIDELFTTIKDQQGRLDLLVNNAFKGVVGIGANVGKPFWEQEVYTWDDVINVGLRCHFVATQKAALMMIPNKEGVIVNISSPGALFDFFTIGYGVGKAGLDKMSAMTGKELKKHNVAVMSLWPGLVRTEHMENFAARASKESKIAGVKMDISKGESVEYSGRAIVGLMNDASVIRKTGKTVLTTDLGREYGFTDVDGKEHLSMRSVKGMVAQYLSPTLAMFIPSFIRLPWGLILWAAHHFA